MVTMAEVKGKGVTFGLLFSYVFDWIVIVVFVGIGAYLSTISPNMRPFNIYDPSISFPYRDETVPIWLAGVLAILAPAGIIFLVAMIFVPGPTVSKSIPKSLIWRRKLWEWYAGWSGLGLSVGATFFIVSAMKNLFGKPRPHTLEVCQPDLENIAKYIVGGYTNGFVNSQLVSADICQQTDQDKLNDTFCSFPSGHSSISAAGLVYLSLFLASKLAITIPFLAPRSYSHSTHVFSAFPSRTQNKYRSNAGTRTQGFSKNEPNLTSTSESDPYAGPTGHDDAEIAARSQSAAPPIYLLVLAFIPTAVSIWICATRFSDLWHFGFDILFAFFIGFVLAVFSFRFYHLPISGGAGWAWGPRSARRAWWAGIGVGSYAKIAGDDDHHSNGDVETGAAYGNNSGMDHGAGSGGYDGSGSSANAPRRQDDTIELLPRSKTPLEEEDTSYRGQVPRPYGGDNSAAFRGRSSDRGGMMREDGYRGEQQQQQQMQYGRQPHAAYGGQYDGYRGDGNASLHV